METIPHPDNCPFCGGLKFMKASMPTTDRAVWVCAACIKKVGDAGSRDICEDESFIITPGDVAEWDPK
jgi:hypothetical protein